MDLIIIGYHLSQSHSQSIFNHSSKNLTKGILDHSHRYRRECDITMPLPKVVNSTFTKCVNSTQRLRLFHEVFRVRDIINGSAPKPPANQHKRWETQSRSSTRHSDRLGSPRPHALSACTRFSWPLPSIWRTRKLTLSPLI